jgi:hypothetical protein
MTENTNTAFPPTAPFSVKNISRAKKIAQMLWGPRARVWTGRAVEGYVADVIIGTEDSMGRKLVHAHGANISEALRDAVAKYLEAQKTDAASYTKAVNTLLHLADITEFVRKQ